MIEGIIDLHVHTTASDGTLSPGELIRYAITRKLAAVAITDHDTIEGLPEAMAVAEAEGFELIPGVEISVVYKSGEMHILGYYLDIKNNRLQRSLSELRGYRDNRNPQMIAKLQALGMEITMEEVRAKAQGTVVGRPHFASVLVEKGYVTTVGEAFERYLAAGKPAYVAKEKLTPEEGIKLIRDAGGIPVLAHPKYLLGDCPMEFVEEVKRLKGYGLEGLEAYYSGHSTDETKAFLKIAEEEGLLVTGGTDFHGANKPDLEIGIGQGDLRIPYSLLTELKQRKGRPI